MKILVSTLLLGSLLAIASPSNAQMTPAATSTDSTALQAYVGTYTFGSGSPITKYKISSAKGELYGEADEYGKNKLVKQAAADTYQSTSSYGAMITFVRDATSKTVNSLTLVAQGTELSAKKDTP